MPERQVARPKPPATPPGVAKADPSGPAAPEPARPDTAAGAAPAEPSRPPKEDLPALEFSDSQFGESGFGDTGIEVEHDIDPLRAEIEQAAVLFANGQDSAARSVLEMCARSHDGADAERLWRMLLDLVQVLGDRAAFDKLGMEFAQACETSPPTWRQPEAVAPKAGSGEKALMVQGVVCGADSSEVLKLKAAVEAKAPVRVDLGKLASCDDAAAGALCELLRLARKQGVVLTLVGTDTLVSNLEGRLVVGQPESAGSWLLLLELYQRLGIQEVFEEKAVDYAVTFEVSPPSWEVIKADPKACKAAAAPDAPQEDVLFLSGELKNYRFGELPNYLDSTDLPILDFSQVKRLDFFSAGLLSNILEPYWRQGKEVTIRNPHHLVAELLGIVGVNHVARIIVPKF